MGILIALIWRNCCQEYRSQNHFKLQPVLFALALIDVVCVCVYDIRCVCVCLCNVSDTDVSWASSSRELLLGATLLEGLRWNPPSRSLSLCQKLSRELLHLGGANCYQINISRALSDPAFICHCLSQSLLRYCCLLFDFTSKGEWDNIVLWMTMPCIPVQATQVQTSQLSSCWILF